MDPNAAYERITDITNANLAGAIPSSNAEATLDELTQLVEGLDIWLKKGGFLPTAWKNALGPNPAHVMFYESRVPKVTVVKHGEGPYGAHYFVECETCGTVGMTPIMFGADRANEHRETHSFKAAPSSTEVKLKHPPGVYAFYNHRLAGPFKDAKAAASYGIHKWGNGDRNTVEDAIVFEVW